MSQRQPLIHNQPQNPEGRVEVGLVLRQGTGLALSISILPPGCSQKKVASLMNTSNKSRRFYHVSADGIRAVDVTSNRQYLSVPHLYHSLDVARDYQRSFFHAQKPRVAPRMAVGVVVAQEVSHAYA